MKHSVKPESLIFLATLAAVGVLFIVIGALCTLGDHVFLVNVFATLGGAILGAASSLLLARFFEPSKMDLLFEMISASHDCSLTRDDRIIEPFRLKYHGYLRSHDSEGGPIWRYRVFDFTQSRLPGHLHAVVPVPLPDGGTKQFVYDGFVCGQHLIMVGKATAGAEPVVIHVFPNGCSIEGSTISGLCFVRSFDKSQLVAPTLLATTALASNYEAGPVSDEEGKRLTSLWDKQFLKHNEFNFENSQAGVANHRPATV